MLGQLSGSPIWMCRAFLHGYDVVISGGRGREQVVARHATPGSRPRHRGQRIHNCSNGVWCVELHIYYYNGISRRRLWFPTLLTPRPRSSRGQRCGVGEWGTRILPPSIRTVDSHHFLRTHRFLQVLQAFNQNPLCNLEVDSSSLMVIFIIVPLIACSLRKAPYGLHCDWRRCTEILNMASWKGQFIEYPVKFNSLTLETDPCKGLKWLASTKN